MILRFFIILITLVFYSSSSFAIIEPRPLSTDKRLKVITYQPNQIIKFVGHYEFLSSIVFEEGEEIKTIFMGNSTLWDVVKSGHRLFLKPIEDNATTNMTIISDKRIYQFELHAEEVDKEKGIEDEDLSFVMKFLYPGESRTDSVVTRFNSATGPDLTQPEKYNFNYTISGAGNIAPLRAFDDNEFTYFLFPNKNADIPAFFLVSPDGSESIVNYRIMGDYIVVERVSSQFTLRLGNEVACIFNESRPLPPKKKK